MITIYLSAFALPDQYIPVCGAYGAKEAPGSPNAVYEFYCDHYDRNARLWLAGNDRFDPFYTHVLQRQRGSLRSESHVTFTGKVSRAELYAYYRAADVFVCASEHEGFCITVAEAMAFQLPVLAYAAGAVPEILDGA
ncbi:MAG TPA: glycosyltransferase family 4 protein [Roseiflexaceae bacterium]|nr:glycosyltransferase family 4 protein [Roseiflexaceae bacterium]